MKAAVASVWEGRGAAWSLSLVVVEGGNSIMVASRDLNSDASRLYALRRIFATSDSSWLSSFFVSWWGVGREEEERSCFPPFFFLYRRHTVSRPFSISSTLEDERVLKADLALRRETIMSEQSYVQEIPETDVGIL